MLDLDGKILIYSRSYSRIGYSLAERERMRKISEDLEKCRVRSGPMRSDATCGNNGAFLVSCPDSRRRLFVIVSNGESWEHVSAHISNRPKDTPTWLEMCYVKDLFWLAEECVIQYHPPKSAYINYHPGTLHLWRPTDKVVPVPPTYLV